MAALPSGVYFLRVAVGREKRVVRASRLRD